MAKQLILASASPRRAELLRQIGLEFKVIPSAVTEELPGQSVTPEKLVADLAMQKAEWVAQGIEDGLIIGADTIVVLGDLILGKPDDSAAAAAMLRLLSGQEHSVFTGVALIEKPLAKAKLTVAETKVQFRPLTETEIAVYVASKEPLDKAGAYGIQGRGAALVTGINGCYFNVVGLPLSKLVVLLRDFGISL